MTYGQSIYRPRRRRFGAFGPFLGAVVEIVFFVFVANVIGFGYAVLAALATSAIGLWLMRRAGFRAWRSLRSAMAEADPATRPYDHTGTISSSDEARPEDRIADAGVTLLAGTVLVLPGFVTDAAALLLLLPPVRTNVGRRLAAAALRTFPARPRAGASPDGTVIEGEVVDESDTGGATGTTNSWRQVRDPNSRDPGEPDGG
ncbi:FxsA family protein [Actinobacteria bacterium YIM 96077]|uniref:FxsA family protein n=1 Tax=Phytoactinopolyspora halophila TaxID=1981511 RepID=A0A329QZC2_9ACTN|nr:FxsA family protein [Phytoactinopolyspora halophila]AYY13292.1 FxsA family protein [Actinobacteria bacterium YIM 96077]RAW17473.1 hypothetical protein DPM12_05545 [Phytoactinopolyspora halophila]